MSTPPPPPKKPAAPRAVPPSKRRSPPANAPRRVRRDWETWNLLVGMGATILAVGFLVWGLRNLGPAATSPPTVAVATPLPGLPTQPRAASTSAVGPVETPTLAAPDALTNGPYAEVTPVQSTVGGVDRTRAHPTLPPQIPGPHIAFSQDSYDWGQITATATVSQVITIANIGNRTLLVDSLVSNCKCLSGTVSSNKLPVGTRALLAVTYNPILDEAQGAVLYSLTIVTNAADDPIHELTFRATVP